MPHGKRPSFIMLRLFIGLRMLEIGAISFNSEEAAQVGVTRFFALLHQPFGWLWPLMIATAGIFLLLSAIIDLSLKGKIYPDSAVPVLRLLSHFRSAGYFYAGAVWLSFTYSSFILYGFGSMEVMSLTYLGTIAGLIFHGALKSRNRIKGVSYESYEKIGRHV